MTNLDIAYQRLHNQLISQQTFEKPGDVVQWLGAVQAQDYAAAKWALGLRLQGVTEQWLNLILYRRLSTVRAIGFLRLRHRQKMSLRRYTCYQILTNTRLLIKIVVPYLIRCMPNRREIVSSA